MIYKIEIFVKTKQTIYAQVTKQDFRKPGTNFQDTIHCRKRQVWENFHVKNDCLV